jgi:hypothetical protein
LLAARRLLPEQLEGRLMLAQTTGLFFNEPAASAGYVLFAPNATTTTYLLDKDANVVNQWQSAYQPGLLAYLQEDGSLIRNSAPHGQGGNGFIEAAGSGGLLERFDWDGTKTWEFAYDSSTYISHHDIEIMPNGNILLIAWETKDENDAIAAGRNMALPGSTNLLPDHIVEVQPDYLNGGGDVVWEWHVWDHLVQDFDENQPANWHGADGVEEHPELIDINYVSTGDPEGGGQANDWTHANGIDYNAELDQVLLSVREFSEFWIIDHSTTTEEAAEHTGGNSGKGGDLLYRWGNPQAYKRGDDSDRVLYYQHDAKWVTDDSPGAGNITVFDNGVGDPDEDPYVSRVHELTPPVDENGDYAPLGAGEPHGPASTEWTYTGTAADFSAIISGAQRLANGNTLITYGVKGAFSEVTPSGEEVWRYVSPYIPGGTLGPEDPIPSLGLPPPLLNSLLANFTFRAIHYPHDYLAQIASTVDNRQLFYKDSPKWNVTNANLPGNSDDNAIAPDKTAYLPDGATSTFANVSSYTRGINGLLVDLAGQHGAITAGDFIFKVGNDNSPASWATATGPTTVTVRTGAGLGGTDRVELKWADGAIQNTWLQVIVRGNDALGGSNTNTGLATSDVFYFGSAPADSGAGDASGYLVNSTDETSARNDPHSVVNPAAVTNVNDFNRDGQVNSTDQFAARLFATTLEGQLSFLQVGGVIIETDEESAAALAVGGDSGLGSALASAPARVHTLAAGPGRPQAMVPRPARAAARVATGPTASAVDAFFDQHSVPKSQRASSIVVDSEDTSSLRVDWRR